MSALPQSPLGTDAANPTGDTDAQYPKQPAAYKCAENTDNDVAEQTKTIALANNTC